MQTITPRQVWNLPTLTSADPGVYCTPLTLPAGGILSFATDNVVTITKSVVFQPLCTDAVSPDPSGSISPFYASSTPQIYVVAAATVLAWVLVTMLVISPRTFMTNLDGGPSSFSVGMGIIGGANGGATSSVGIGSRPWLQKAAALTVAVSLTIATAETFRVAADHYPAGIDGNAMRRQVEQTLEIRITRLISDIFVWLAQVQTLIRLFPRHKEKVLIKWIGFALILLDTTFSCLNSFVVNDYRRPRDFQSAIAALSYLFELALSLLYAAWVIYYTFTKRRYAWYHPNMRTISLIALLALVAILTPVVFFITDIAFSSVAGWGDYFRWVGAAAASVIVWEWVERIELLERDEKKDGILGREIFDGDEMLDTTPSGGMTYLGGKKSDYYSSSQDGSGSSGDNSIELGTRKIKFDLPRRLARGRVQPGLAHRNDRGGAQTARTTRLGGDSPSSMSLPRTTSTAQAVIPPSRTDTTSAASTVYIVQHDGRGEVQPVRRRLNTPEPFPGTSVTRQTTDAPVEDVPLDRRTKGFTSGWQNVSNPFKRKRTTPPAEVRAVLRSSTDQTPDPSARLAQSSRQALYRARLTGAMSRMAKRTEAPHTPNVDEMSWTIVPAQPRGTTWSPSPITERQSADGNTDAGGTPAASERDPRLGTDATTTGVASERSAMTDGTPGAASAKGQRHDDDRLSAG